MKKQFGKAWFLFATRGLTVLSNFLSMLAIAYCLGIDEYGRFVFIWTMGIVASSVISFGLPVYLLREMSITSASDGRGVSVSFALKMGVALPAVFVGIIWGLGSLGLHFDVLQCIGVTRENLPLVLILAFFLNLNTNFSSATYALGFMNASMFQRDALPQVFASLAAVIAVVMGQAQSTFVLLLISIMMGLWLIAIAIAILVANRSKAIFGAPRGGGGYTVSFWGGAVLGMVWAQIDVLVGSVFMTPAQLGAYNILRRVANLAALPVTISTWATVGDFSRAFAAGDRAKIEETNRRALTLSVYPGAALLLICVPLYAVLAHIYTLPRGESLFTAYLILLAQSAVLLAFAPGMTVAQSSGNERAVVWARLVGLGVFLAVVSVDWPIGSDVKTAISLVSGTLAMSGFVWIILNGRLAVDTSMCVLRKGGPK